MRALFNLYVRDKNMEFYEREVIIMFIEFIMTYVAVAWVIGMTVLLGLTAVGIILLGDVIFKTNKGRRFIRRLMELEPGSN